MMMATEENLSNRKKFLLSNRKKEELFPSDLKEREENPA